MIPLLLLLGTALASWQDVVASSRLPRAEDGSIGVIPENYRVELTINDLNSENFAYSGVVEVDFEWNLGDFEYLALNEENFFYKSVTLDGQAVEHFQEGGFIFITIPVGFEFQEKTTVRIEFTGRFDYVTSGGWNEGFFVDYYVGPDELTYSNILVTQFESCGGRKAFPMFDEPEYKSTFDLEVTLHGNEGYYALWNTDTIDVIQQNDSSVTYVFDRSPKMSSYLFSLSVVNYVYVEGTAPETGARMRVYSPKWVENIQFSSFALDAGIAILDGLSDFFGYNYSDAFQGVPKLDQIGFPNSGLGAMENWGLVTYDYTWLYTNTDKMTEFWTSDVAATVAHELVHQWTGNLITAEWWDELWINEGFAEWGGAFGLQFVDSSITWENYLYLYDSDWAYWVDQTRNSRPIVNKQNNDGYIVDTCEAIDAQFDGIAYSKGSLIIRMIIDVIGIDAFQAGMQKYLNENKFTNPTTETWFSYISEFVDPAVLPEGKTLYETFKGYFLQMGLPLITFKDSHEAFAERFLWQDTEVTLPESSLNYNWNIPVKILKFDSCSTEIQWLTEETMAADRTLNFGKEHIGRDFWPFPDSRSYTRTSYGSISNFNELITQLMTQVSCLETVENIQLLTAGMIMDQFYLATALGHREHFHTNYGHVMEPTRLMAIAEISHRPQDWIVWAHAGNVFDRIVEDEIYTYRSGAKLVRFSSNRALFEDYMQSLASTNRYMSNDLSGSDEKKMASLYTSWACNYGSMWCLSEASKLALDVVNGNGDWRDLDVHIRLQAKHFAVRAGTQQVIDLLVDEIYSGNQREIISNLEALAYLPASHAEKIVEVFEFISDDYPSYVSEFAMKAAEQPEIRDIVIDLFIDDQAIIEVIKEEGVINSVVKGFCEYMQENNAQERV